MSEYLPSLTKAELVPESGDVGGPDLKLLAQQMPKPELLSDLADLYKLFGDSTRLQILSALRLSPLCVSELAQLLNMSSSAISHQLRSLRTHNLAKAKREGKLIYYSLADEHVKTIIDMGLDHIEE